MTAVVSGDQQQSSRKRRRGAIEQDYSTTATSQHLEREVKRRCQRQQKANTAYYESLSKVWLTPGALAELDRRNGKSVSPVERNRDKPRQLRSLSKLLKCFAKDGGPDLRDLRGYPEPSTPKSTAPVMPSNQTSSSTESNSTDTSDSSTPQTTTAKTKKTSPYDPNFEQNLIDNGIYPFGYEFPDNRVSPRPSNENEVLSRLYHRRASLSPSRFSNEEFYNFQRVDVRALNEHAVMSDVFPIIHGSAPIPSAKNLVFRNLKPITHSNLVDAKPDFYDGARPAQIHLPIREELGRYIIPSTQRQAPALPNFFTEAKGPEGSTAVSKRQACFDGAFGARGIHKLRSYNADPLLAYDNNAYTITSTLHDGLLRIYTSHPVKPINPESPPEYSMTLLNTFTITGSPQGFREWVSALRNARDWAKEQRDVIIAAANGRMADIRKETSTLEPSAHSMSQSTIAPVVVESETSADELSRPGSRFSNKRLKGASGRRSFTPDLKKRSKTGLSGAYSRSRSRGWLLQRR